MSSLFDRTVRAGLSAASTGNHMWLPMSYGDLDAEYVRLTTGISIWDVSAQRHIEVAGPNADAVVQHLTIVETGGVEPGRATYAPDGRLRGPTHKRPK